MNFNFKKIASAASSLLMVGSTVGLAIAASYPAPFASSGSADVALVYGSSATVDLASVVELSGPLNALAGGSGTGGGSTLSGGDFIKLAKTSDNLNLGDVASTVFGTIINEDDMPNLLVDGTYKNDDNEEFDYEQKITLGTGIQLNYFSDSDYQDQLPTLGVNLTSSQVLMNYSFDFTSSAESDVSSGDLVDFETTDINILGKTYFVSDFDNATLDMTLLDAANSATVVYNPTSPETSTITAGTKTYAVVVTFIDDNEVRLTVNGEATDKLQESETQKLSDGSYVSVKSIDYVDSDTRSSSAEISIGNGKIILNNGQDIEMNDDTVEGVTAEIVRGTGGSKDSINRINIVWALDDDAFITPNSELVMPGFESIKFSMGDFVQNAQELTLVQDDGSTRIEIQTEIKDGPISVPILYANASGEYVGIGQDATHLLRTAIGTNIVVNDTLDKWLIGTWNSTTEAESYLITFSFNKDNGINRTTFKKAIDGGVETVCADVSPGNDCSLGSLTLTVTNAGIQGSDKWVNLTAGGGGSFNYLYTAKGMRLNLPYEAAVNSTLLGAVNFTETEGADAPAGHNYDSIILGFRGEDKDDNIGAGGQFNVTINDNSNGEAEVSAIAGGRATITDPDDSNHIMVYNYADVPTLLERLGASSDQRSAKVTYSGSESYGELYVASSTATVSSNTTNSGVVTITDSDISTVSTKNLIVVGGSCVNTVARDLLGSSTAVCGADFTTKTGIGAGQFLIQSFTNPWSSSKVALLVAGYEASDTKNAATYLRTQTVDTAVGKKYVGTSATSAELQVS